MSEPSDDVSVQNAISREAVPFARADIQQAFQRPHRIIELVLADRDRLTASIVEQRHLAALAALLIFTSCAFAFPYGFVLGWRTFWRIAVLFLGSTGICFPSLLVFSGYLGCRINVE